MATENQLVPQMVELKGGLDFTTPKLSASPGTLSDCYNFEVSDRLGYARSMGYERFDGGYAPSLAYTNSIVLNHQNKTYSPGLPYERSPLYIPGAKLPFGMLITRGALSSVVAITDFVQAAALIAFLQNPAGTFTIESPDGTTTWNVTGFSANSGADARLTTGIRNTQFNNISARVDTIDTDSFQSPVIGLEGYKDQVYAVRNLNALAFESGSVEPYPNETVVALGLEAKVLRVSVVTGSWAAGDAAGTIYTTADEIAEGQNYDLVERGITNAFTALSVQPTAQQSIDNTIYAGMWRSFSRRQADAAGITPGWHPVDLGYELTFTGGTSNGPPLTFQRGEINSVTAPVAAQSVPTTASTGGTPSWTLEGGASSTLDAVQTDDQEYVQVSTAIQNPNTILQALNFSTAQNIPVSSEVTGISLKLSVAAPTVSTTKRPSFAVRALSGGVEVGSGKSTGAVRTASGAFTAADIVVLGGQNDNWGITDLKAALADNFGFNIAPRADTTGVETVDYRINFVELTVYYTATTERYYFYNGVDDVTAQITNYSVDEGDWTLNNAHGYIQISNIQPVTPGTRTYILAGDQIRTLPNGGGSLIATVESSAVGTALPGLYLLEEKESRYQMMVANFYPLEDWEAIYGVTGASRAFSYDGFYFRWIYTGSNGAIDTPRHVEFFLRHLALGYKSGELRVSRVGYPEDFNGENGASVFRMGDEITGLIRMNGSTLGVACKSSIQSLTGSSIDDFSQRVLNPNDGAIEYTVADVGRAVYCSAQGITLFEQTAAYGDFAGVRLSAPITSWLTPRLQGRVPPVDIYVSVDDTSKNPPSFIRQTTTVGVLVAITCRSKNQYRLYFKDGTVLTMTLMGAEQVPVFTFQQHIVHKNDSASFIAPYSAFIPRAECSWIDSLGRERIHMAHYNAALDTPNLDNPYFVYEFERSWTFDGRGIPAYFITNANFQDSPFFHRKIMKMRAHGLGLGYAPFNTYVQKDYKLADPYNAGETEIQDISLPKPPDVLLTADYIPYTSICSPQKEGWSFSMNFFNYTLQSDEGPYAFKLADPSPPCAYQSLLIQYTPSRADL